MDEVETVRQRMLDIVDALIAHDTPEDMWTAAALFNLGLREARDLCKSPEDAKALLHGWGRIASNYPVTEATH